MQLSICVKLGGSLLRTPQYIPPLIEVLTSHAGKIILVNGSGPLATCYEYWRANKLNLDVAQERNLRAKVRSTASALLVGFHDSLAIAETAVAARALAVEGKLPIAEPLHLLHSIADHRNGSGVLAAELCRSMDLKTLVVLTDVDGIKPNAHSDKVYRTLTTTELCALGRTCLDSGMEDIIDQIGLDCVVLNGRYPGRLGRFLESKEISVGTQVLPASR